MHIDSLKLLNFKNLPQVELALCQDINGFVGSNGAGKTNLLDAIYYLSFCKSYFNSADSQNITHQEDFFVIQAQLKRYEENEELYCGLKKGQKKVFKRNKKEYAKFSDHIGFIPLVMISPSDERLILEGSDQRRKYIDSVISQYDKGYLDDLIKYNRILTQRNVLLKKAQQIRKVDHAVLDVLDEQLVFVADKLYQSRFAFIEELIPIFQQYYSYISDGKEVVSIEYKSNMTEGLLINQLKEARDRDVAIGYTTKGIHKDDLVLKLGDYAIKRLGSQGQKKTYLIALKLAQYDFLSKHKNLKPLILLDDIFDKLDAGRVSRLIKLVAGDNFAQIFITDTEKERLASVLQQTGKAYSVFDVNDGVVLAS